MAQAKPDCILLQSAVTLKHGVWHLLGLGDVYLTAESLVWESALSTPWRQMLYLSPKRVVVDLHSIATVTRKDRTGYSLVEVRVPHDKYEFRVGSPSIWRFKAFSGRADALFDAIEAARAQLEKAGGETDA